MCFLFRRLNQSFSRQHELAPFFQSVKYFFAYFIALFLECSFLCLINSRSTLFHVTQFIKSAIKMIWCSIPLDFWRVRKGALYNSRCKITWNFDFISNCRSRQRKIWKKLLLYLISFSHQLGFASVMHGIIFHHVRIPSHHTDNCYFIHSFLSSSSSFSSSFFALKWTRMSFSSLLNHTLSLPAILNVFSGNKSEHFSVFE